MRKPALAALLFALPLLAYSQGLSPVFPPSPRMAALGGPHAASAHGVDAIFENPAGFAVDGRIINVSSIVPQVTGPVFDIANLLMGGGDLEAGIPSILDSAGRLYVQLDMAGPLSFSYVGSGLGFGLYNRTLATINASSLLNASLTLQEDLLLAGGYAHRFLIAETHIIDIGIMPKGFMRSLVSIDGTIEDLLDLMDIVSDPATLMSDYDFTVVSGIGFDAGARWSPTPSFALGLVVRDAYSPAIVSAYPSMEAFLDGSSSPDREYKLIPADLSVGVAYNAPFAAFRRLGIDLSVYLDYRDILDLLSPVPRNPILNVGLGTELILLDIMSFRAGINDALLAAGFGLDLSFFTLSLAMYGSELGMEPGKRPAYNVVVALDFRY
ncbi:MAG: hypothetical protein A3J97_10300 [Spirochaetes bacterium RIFOXYC1_FULL_54_7]|nr:MAG: hypothetical protein A3J97_10300 [Spirochaetes bacterium RIFOXYC1_FULL_54_7]